MKSLNKVTLIGHVGEEPRITSMKDGTKCAGFSLATSNSWVDKKTKERKSITEWHRISTFNQPIAEIIEKYVKKGSALYVEGELKTRKYTNKENVEVSTTEVVLNGFGSQLILLSDKKTEEDTSKFEKTGKEYDAYDDLNDDVPF